MLDVLVDGVIGQVDGETDPRAFVVAALRLDELRYFVSSACSLCLRGITTGPCFSLG